MLHALDAVVSSLVIHTNKTCSRSSKKYHIEFYNDRSRQCSRQSCRLILCYLRGQPSRAAEQFCRFCFQASVDVLLFDIQDLQLDATAIIDLHTNDGCINDPPTPSTFLACHPSLERANNRVTRTSSAPPPESRTWLSSACSGTICGEISHYCALKSHILHYERCLISSLCNTVLQRCQPR